jgi:hypothetical protein
MSLFLRHQLRLAALARLNNGGTQATRSAPAPAPELHLYEYEASPWCRKVRETLCVLGLKSLVLPCPRETLIMEGAFSSLSPHKKKVKDVGGELLFPFLVDVTKGVQLNQSADICKYLWSEYGQEVTERPATDSFLNSGKLPSLVDFALLTAPSGLRPLPSHGLLAAKAKQPKLPLVLEGCEPDPDSKRVRETLCVLQLAYESVPRERAAGAKLLGPNTGAELEGADAIIQHLDDEYRLGGSLPYNSPPPNPNLGDAHRRSWLAAPVELLTKGMKSSGEAV